MMRRLGLAALLLLAPACTKKDPVIPPNSGANPTAQAPAAAAQVPANSPAQPTRPGQPDTVAIDSGAPLSKDISLLATPEHPGDDLPPTGTRSLLDFLVQNENGIPKKPIYPFTKLQELMGEQTIANGPDASPLIENNLPLLGVLIPFSRSLQRQFSNYVNPRAVITAANEPKQTPVSLGMHLQKRLFLGHAKDSGGTMEAISYNEGAGRFEFQLILDYLQDKQPRVVYASRALCVTCHKNHAPFFQQGTWEETNANEKIYKNILAKQPAGNNGYFEGVRIQPPGQLTDVARRFNQSTDLANFLLPTQKVWKDWCGENTDEGYRCRAIALQMGLRYAINNQVPDVESKEYQDLLQYLKKRNVKGFIVPNFNLRNRNPLEKVTDTAPSTDTDDSAPVRDLDKAKLDNLLATMRFPDYLEPAKSESHVPPGQEDDLLKFMKWDSVEKFRLMIYRMKDYFTASDLQALRKASGERPTQIDSQLAILAREKNEALSDKPFRRATVMRALLGKLQPGQALPANCCEVAPAEMGQPVIAQEGQGLHEFPFGKDPKVKPYVQFCGRCHIPMTFLIDVTKMKSDDEVIAALSATKTRIEKIQHKLGWENPALDVGDRMPRTGSREYQAMEQDDKDNGANSVRHQMLKQLEEWHKTAQ